MSGAAGALSRLSMAAALFGMTIVPSFLGHLRSEDSRDLSSFFKPEVLGFDLDVDQLIFWTEEWGQRLSCYAVGIPIVSPPSHSPLKLKLLNTDCLLDFTPMRPVSLLAIPTHTTHPPWAHFKQQVLCPGLMNHLMAPWTLFKPALSNKNLGHKCEPHQ